jgi:hypothetical protein
LPLLFLCVTGCASIESAHPARPISPDGRPSQTRETASGLVVSGEELDELSSTHFGVLAFTFVNPTNDWVRIDNVALDFGSKPRNDSIVLPFGEEIASWELATSQRNAVHRANTTTLLSALMIGGAVTAAAGGRSTGGRIGGLVALGAAGGLWAQALADKTSAVTFPPAHLFATPFSVPPGLFSKKWVLLNGPKTPEVGCISAVVVEYDTSKGRERVQLSFGRSGSYWQNAACGPA